jgi:hypothetical protein
MVKFHPSAWVRLLKLSVLNSVRVVMETKIIALHVRITVTLRHFAIKHPFNAINIATA